MRGNKCPGERSQALIYKNTSCYAKLKKKKNKTKQRNTEVFHGDL